MKQENIQDSIYSERTSCFHFEKFSNYISFHLHQPSLLSTKQLQNQEKTGCLYFSSYPLDRGMHLQRISVNQKTHCMQNMYDETTKGQAEARWSILQNQAFRSIYLYALTIMHFYQSYKG